MKSISFKEWLLKQEAAATSAAPAPHADHGFRFKGGGTIWSQGQGGDAYDYWRDRQRIRPGLDTLNVGTGALFGAIDKARGDGASSLPNSGMFQPYFSDYEQQQSKSKNYFTVEKEETVHAANAAEAKKLRLQLNKQMNSFMRDQYLANYSASGGKPVFWKDGEYKLPLATNAAVLLAYRRPHHIEYGDEEELSSGIWRIIAYGQYRYPRNDIFYGNQLSADMNNDKIGAVSQDTAGQNRTIGNNRF